MRRTPVVLAALALSLLSARCWDDVTGLSGPDFPESTLQGSAKSYTYCAFDTFGTALVRGVMFLAIDDSDRVTGLWDLRRIGTGPTMIGPQVGTGRLEGFREGATIWMNLNPQYADNNVMLFGTIRGSGIYGTWEYIGFPGVLSRGRFRALRLSERPEPPSER